MTLQASLSDAQSLTACLAVEGFLLATVSLAVSIGTPGKRRVANLPISAFGIAISAAVLSIIVATAGVAAWIGLYGEGTLLPLRQLWIAVVLLIVVAAQPILALGLALGARSAD